MCFSVSDNHNKNLKLKMHGWKVAGKHWDWTTGSWIAELVNLLGYLSPKEVEGTMAALKILAIL